VAVHAGGIVHSHRGTTRIIPWEDISSVTQAIAVVDQSGGQGGTTHTYTIELKDLSKFVYTNKLIKDVEELGNIILENTSFVILPQVRLKYDSGEMVTFGRLGLNKEGLHQKKNKLGWEDIQGVKVSEGYLTVNKQGKWLRWRNIEASSVPNLHVFLIFVNEIVGMEAG
jgi:hypothetical protein